MTDRKKIFCEEYLKSHNATEAAKKAGYSAKTAYSSGNRLLKNVDVREYLNAVTQEAHSDRIATANEVLEYLSDTMRARDEKRKERTKAAELLGKRYGLFSDNQEDLRDNDVVVNINLTNCKGEINEDQ